jgi:hypothetical protein
MSIWGSWILSRFLLGQGMPTGEKHLECDKKVFQILHTMLCELFLYDFLGLNKASY